MNIFKLTLISIPLLLIGCGSDSKNDKDTKKSTSIKEAKNNIKSLTLLSGITSNSESSKTNNNNLQKSSNSELCSDGGSLSLTFFKETTTMVFKACKNEGTYTNGTIMITENQENYNEKVEMKNLTMRDDELDFYTTNFISVDNEVEGWHTMNGDLKLTSQCFTGNFDFKTLEKMYDLKTDDNYIKKGKLELNGATYNFNYPNVTITTKKEKETLSQDELNEKMESVENCEE